MKKKIAIALVLVLTLLATSATAFAGAAFTDLKTDNWAYEAVSAASDKGILKGYPDGTFKPSGTLTAGEFIKMALIAATGEDVGNAASGNWATNYYNKALELKYFTAADIAATDLSKGIDRAHMALIISSILGDVKIDNVDKIQQGIKDVTSGTAYKDAIVKAYGSGILTGYTDSTFGPSKTLTRAEAATVIYRFVEPSKRVIPDTSGNGGTAAYTTVNLRDYVDPSTVKAALTAQGIPDAITGDFTEKAELYKDASTFNMKLTGPWNESVGMCVFDHTLSGFIYLVKDKQIIEYCTTTPHYNSAGDFIGTFGSMSDTDVRTADYIICVSAASDVITKLVPNPFK